MKKGKPMLTTTEIMRKLNAPYPTVIGWIKKGLLAGATQQDTPRGPVWMVPADVVE